MSVLLTRKWSGLMGGFGLTGGGARGLGLEGGVISSGRGAVTGRSTVFGPPRGPGVTKALGAGAGRREMAVLRVFPMRTAAALRLIRQSIPWARVRSLH